MKRTNLTVVVYLSLVFLSGALVGGVGVGLYHARAVSAKADPSSPDAMRQRYRETLRTRLQLSAGQLQKLDAILSETHLQFKALRVKYRPEVKAIQAAQADSIRAILDDRQRSEYEKMRQEREEREKRERHDAESGKHPHGPGC
jgi:hypothetical protein